MSIGGLESENIQFQRQQCLCSRTVQNTEHRRSAVICVALALVMAPAACFANGWVSGVNAFRQTPEFYFLFAAIVLVETTVVWLWLRPISGFTVFWRVILMNVLSSLAGELLFRVGWAPSFIDIWQQAIPFFLVTVALETPAMRLLFRKRLPDWKRTVLVSVTANVASYALLMLIEEPVRIAWLRHLKVHDQRILSQWNNIQMLAELPGRIYTADDYRLKYFDFADHKWHTVRRGPQSMDPHCWDVEGDLLAYLPLYANAAQTRRLMLTTLPDCIEFRRFELPPSQEQIGWEVAISPDQSRLAVLVPQHSIEGEVPGFSNQILAMAHFLVVFNIATGEMSVCPRKASNHLCWLPDSRTILFSSLQDQELYELTKLAEGWEKTYHLQKPNSPFRRLHIFAWNPERGSVDLFANDPVPFVQADSNRLAFVDGTDALTFLDLRGHGRSRMTLGQTCYGSLAFSPDGRFAAVPLGLGRVAVYGGFPTIVDFEDPSRRYYLGPRVDRVVWTKTGAQ